MSKARNLSALATNLDTSGTITSTGLDTTAIASLSGGVDVYDSINLVPLVALDSGDLAYVGNTNRFYVSNGTGWYNITLINETPTITLATTSYLIEPGDSATITPTATDPEGFPITWSSAFTAGDSAAFNIAQADNEFTVTIDSVSTGIATWQIKASDGINIAVKNVALTTPAPGSGLSSSYPATSADGVLSVLGSAATNGYYWILPSGSAESAVQTYCYFDHDNNKGYMLLVSADHSNGNTMINGNPASSVGLVREADNTTAVDGTTYDIFNTDAYWRISRDFFDRLETASGGSMEILLMANSNNSTPMTDWTAITHTVSTGDVITDAPGAFCRSSSNGMYNMGGNWYLSDYSGLAYGSYHQGIISYFTTPGYHANDPGSHYGHFHRSGVNTGIYSFGDNVYIQETEWIARYYYFIR